MAVAAGGGGAEGEAGLVVVGGAGGDCGGEGGGEGSGAWGRNADDWLGRVIMCVWWGNTVAWREIAVFTSTEAETHIGVCLLWCRLSACGLSLVKNCWDDSVAQGFSYIAASWGPITCVEESGNECESKLARGQQLALRATKSKSFTKRVK